MSLVPTERPASPEHRRRLAPAFLRRRRKGKRVRRLPIARSGTTALPPARGTFAASTAALVGAIVLRASLARVSHRRSTTDRKKSNRARIELHFNGTSLK